MLISARLCTNTSYLNDFLVQQYINNQRRHFNIPWYILFTIFSPTCFGQCSSHLQGDVLITRITLCIFLIRISPWRWPKHVGENIVNTIYQIILKCLLLVIYIFFDLINARNILFEHIKMIFWSLKALQLPSLYWKSTAMFLKILHFTNPISENTEYLSFTYLFLIYPFSFQTPTWPGPFPTHLNIEVGNCVLPEGQMDHFLSKWRSNSLTKNL